MSRLHPSTAIHFRLFPLGLNPRTVGSAAKLKEKTKVGLEATLLSLVVRRYWPPSFRIEPRSFTSIIRGKQIYY